MQALSNPFAYGTISFSLLVFASWCVGEGGEILGAKYDASIIGGLIIAWLNTSAYHRLPTVDLATNAAKTEYGI
jgi:hypothetical protein